MSDPASNVEIEDVLASVRRLVSTKRQERPQAEIPDVPPVEPVKIQDEALVLTADFRIVKPEHEEAASGPPASGVAVPDEATGDMSDVATPRIMSLEERIAQLEAAVQSHTEAEFEPDGSEDLTQHRPVSIPGIAANALAAGDDRGGGEDLAAQFNVAEEAADDKDKDALGALSQAWDDAISAAAVDGEAEPVETAGAQLDETAEFSADPVGGFRAPDATEPEIDLADAVAGAIESDEAAPDDAAPDEAAPDDAAPDDAAPDDAAPDPSGEPDTGSAEDLALALEEAERHSPDDTSADADDVDLVLGSAAMPADLANEAEDIPGDVPRRPDGSVDLGAMAEALIQSVAMEDAQAEETAAPEPEAAAEPGTAPESGDPEVRSHANTDADAEDAGAANADAEDSESADLGLADGSFEDAFDGDGDGDDDVLFDGEDPDGAQTDDIDFEAWEEIYGEENAKEAPAEPTQQAGMHRVFQPKPSLAARADQAEGAPADIGTGAGTGEWDERLYHLDTGEELGGIDLSADTQEIDEDALRDLVSEIVREELQGALGERITRNVRKLVRREIMRAMSIRDFE